MKKQQSNLFISTTFFLLFCAVFIVGCQPATPPVTMSPEDALRQRAEQVLDAQTNNDWGVVYDLAYAKYRESVTRENFLRFQRTMGYKDLKIKDIVIAEDGNSAKVTVTGTYSAMGGKDFSNVPTIQSWVKENGQWYQVILSFQEMFTQ